MVFHAVDPDRLERAVPDMERHVHAADAACGKLVQQRGCEVQAGGRSGHRATFPRVNGLIAETIGRFVGAFDVRREWHVADGVDGRVHIHAFRPESDSAAAMKVTARHLSLNPYTVRLEHYMCTHAEFLARMHQGLPQLGTPNFQTLNSPAGISQRCGRQLLYEKAFHPSAARNPPAEQPCREHAGVVQYQQVARRQVFANCGKQCVLDDAGVAPEYEQPRGSPSRRRRLSNQLIRKGEVECGNVHTRARSTSTIRHRARRCVNGFPLAPGRRVYDTVIVGGGPAGLSAALILARCRRSVLVCDTGAPRNARARELHGFISRDGVRPLDLLRMGREELRRYDIEPRQIEVTAIHRSGAGFDVTLSDHSHVEALTVLLASGIIDELPGIPGIDECFGISAHHCPYCDGWEVRDRDLVVIGRGNKAAGLALSLKTWSARVVVCSHGHAGIRALQRQQLTAHGIEVDQRRIARLDHVDGFVRELVFADGGRRTCHAIFIAGEHRQRWDLPRQLGCALTRQGLVKTDHLGQTGVPGLYVAGDASRDVQFVVVAAAEGAKAGVAINKALQARAGLVIDAAG